MEAMIKQGYIRLGIDRKVYFEYYQLYKPNKTDLQYYHNSILLDRHLKDEYLKDYREYEASKRLVEVDNVIFITYCRLWVFDFVNEYSHYLNGKDVINNQPCKAEVGKTAIIVELIK